MKIINFKNKKMNLLTKEQHESYKNAKICYICTEKFENKYFKDIKYCKVRDNCHFTGEYRGAAHTMCNLQYSLPEKIHIAFHNRSNYSKVPNQRGVLISRGLEICVKYNKREGWNIRGGWKMVNRVPFHLVWPSRHLLHRKMTWLLLLHHILSCIFQPTLQVPFFLPNCTFLYL